MKIPLIFLYFQGLASITFKFERLLGQRLPTRALPSHQVQGVIQGQTFTLGLAQATLRGHSVLEPAEAQLLVDQSQEL